jgi:hypothetical protein
VPEKGTSARLLPVRSLVALPTQLLQIIIIIIVVVVVVVVVVIAKTARFKP